MEISGIVKHIYPVKQITEKFTKRDFIVTTDFDQQYPQDVIFQLVNTKTDLIEGYKAGNEIKIFFNLRGKSFAGNDGELKCFNNLDCYKIDGKKAYNAPAASSPQKHTLTPSELLNSPNGESDDTPF